MLAICLEEIILRGFLQDSLSELLPAPIAVVTMGLLSTVFGGPIAGAPVLAFLAAIYLGWVRILGGSVVPCIAAHSVFSAIPLAFAGAGP